MSWSISKFAGVCGGIIAVSAVLSLLTPRDLWTQRIWALPGALALMAALFREWRQQLERDRDRASERDHVLVTIGLASHMAEVVFDKHVEFAELYVERLDNGIVEGWRDGPTPDALKFASDLSTLRRRFAVWLTPEVNGALDRFELGLREIGAGEHLLDSIPVGDRRSNLVEEIHRKFGLVVGIHQPDSPDEAQYVGTAMVQHVQAILGIHELTALRRRVVDAAHQALDEPRWKPLAGRSREEQSHDKQESKT